MPNWVYNGLTAQGPHDSVNKLKAQMNTPFVDYIETNGDLVYDIKQIKYSNPIFSFRNIIAPTDLEAYKAPPSFYDRENDNSWYNWNIRNWGTKWDVAVSNESQYSDTYMEETEDEWTASVFYNFNTAWGIPEAALVNLSSQYPDLLFTLSYEEETGWGGEMELLRGTIISHNEYENKCRDCDSINTLGYCEDCENDVCSACSFGAEEECQSHMVESELPPKVQVTENA